MQANAPAAITLKPQETRADARLARRHLAQHPGDRSDAAGDRDRARAAAGRDVGVRSAGQAQAAQPPAIDAPRPEVEQATAPPAAPPSTVPDANAVQTPMKIDTPIGRSLEQLGRVARRRTATFWPRPTCARGESYVVPAGIAYRVIDAR